MDSGPSPHRQFNEAQILLLSGAERSPEPLEAGSAAGPGPLVSVHHLPALLHPLWTDVILKV